MSQTGKTASKAIAPCDASFNHSITPDFARRQLRLSLALVCVLGLAIVAIAASSGFSAKIETAAAATGVRV